MASFVALFNVFSRIYGFAPVLCALDCAFLALVSKLVRPVKGFQMRQWNVPSKIESYDSNYFLKKSQNEKFLFFKWPKPGLFLFIFVLFKLQI